jgi:hypothetical protein
MKTVNPFPGAAQRPPGAHGRMGAWERGSMGAWESWDRLVLDEAISHQLSANPPWSASARGGVGAWEHLVLVLLLVLLLTHPAFNLRLKIFTHHDGTTARRF